MKNLRLFVAVIAIFLCSCIMPNVNALEIKDATQEQLEKINQSLEEKLHSMFKYVSKDGSSGALDTVVFKVIKNFRRYEFDRLVTAGMYENTDLVYNNFIVGNLIESNDMLEHLFFTEEIDTGLTHNGEKLYAKGAFDFGDERGKIKAFYSYGYFECLGEGQCGGTSGGANVDLDIELEFIEPEQKILNNIKTYKEKFKANEILKYDDLYWINMILATDFKTIMSSNIAVDDAKYLTSFFTDLEDNVLMGIENRLGMLSCVDCNDFIDNNTKNTTEVSFGGMFPIMYNNIMYDILDIGQDTMIYYGSVIKIPDTTNEKDYIDTITKKIKDYINNDKYTISITKSKYTISDIQDNMYINPDLENNIEEDIYNLNIEYNNKKYDFLFYLQLVDKNDIEIPVVQYLDKTSNIIMETTSSDIPTNSKILVEIIKDNKERIDDIKTTLNSEKVAIYDISLNSVNGLIKKIENGNVIVKIPVPTDFNEKKVLISYVSDDGSTKENFNYTFETIDNKKYIVFNTNHFSTYVVSEKKEFTTKTSEEIGNNLNETLKSIKNTVNSAGLEINYGKYKITINKDDIKDKLENTVNDLSLEILDKPTKELEGIIKNENFLILKSKESGELPAKEITVSITNEKFINKKVNLYYYNEKTKNIEKLDEYIGDNLGGLKVKLPHYSEYILTTENLSQIENPKTNDSVMNYVALGVISLLAYSFLMIYSSKKKKI